MLLLYVIPGPFERLIEENVQGGRTKMCAFTMDNEASQKSIAICHIMVNFFKLGFELTLQTHYPPDLTHGEFFMIPNPNIWLDGETFS